MWWLTAPTIGEPSVVGTDGDIAVCKSHPRIETWLSSEIFSFRPTGCVFNVRRFNAGMFYPCLTAGFNLDLDDQILCGDVDSSRGHASIQYSGSGYWLSIERRRQIA